MNESKESIKEQEKDIKSDIRETYRTILVPAINKQNEFNLKEEDMGIGTYGQNINLSEEVYKDLVSESYIIENIAPFVIENRYLKDKKYVPTKQVLDIFLKTLGQPRILDKSTLEKGINDGVIQGIFCLGQLEDGKQKPIYWNETPIISFEDDEIIIDKALCKKNNNKEGTEEELTAKALPLGGEYNSIQKVVLTSDVGEIYYTLDGSDPTIANSKYSDPIDITKEGITNLKFIVINKSQKSIIFSEIYDINNENISTDIKTKDMLEIPLKVPKRAGG